MAKTVGTPITAKFTKYGAHNNRSGLYTFDGFDKFVAGTDRILSSHTHGNIVFLYGLNFEELRQHLNNNLKITGVSFSITGGRYGSSPTSYLESSVLAFRVVQGFPTDTSSTGTDIYTDVLGDNSVRVTEGSIPPTTVTTLTHNDISPNFLSWLNSNLTAFLNGYTTNSFGFRFYFCFAQLRAFTMTVEYTYGYNEYKISTAVTPTGGGKVTGGGNYESGTTATLTATPATGYKFVKWVNASGATVSTSATYSLSVTADTTLTAVFEKLTYTITFKNEDGTILQASSVAYGDTPKYTGVTPTKASTVEYSYSFSGWSPSIAAVTGAATYTAQFTATKRRYAITVSAGEGGTVSGGNTYPYGSTVQISATANEGWEFTGWSDGNTDNPRTITVTGTATYTAVFEEKAPLPEMLDFKIINPRNNMQVTIDNPLEAGQEYLIELTANQ